MDNPTPDTDRRAKPKKQGTCQMLIVDRAIVTIGRRWRSKWWLIRCTCSRHQRRKDGTCKHERAVLAQVNPKYLPRTRIDVSQER